MATAEPEAQDPALAPMPTGPAAAATLGAGIGVAFYGLIVLLAAASTGFANLLKWSGSVGPLSGKTIVGVAGWLVAWLVLGRVYKNTDVNYGKVWRYSLLLIAAGLLFTFPPFYDLFAG